MNALSVSISTVLVPRPSHARLINVGGYLDGAYVIPDDLNGVAACFSPGVNNFKTFEDILSAKYGIRCHMCDFSSDIESLRTPLKPNLQTFEKKWLDCTSGSDNISLDDWIYRYENDENDDLILQMDIEGSEYKNILGASHYALKRFRIMIIEFHGLLDSSLFPNVNESDIANCLFKIAKTHSCVHVHANNCCGQRFDKETGLNIPNVLEATFIRSDRLTLIQHEENLRYPQLPSILDVPLNILVKPPLHLNRQWLSGRKRKVHTKLLMLAHHGIYFTIKAAHASRNILSQYANNLKLNLDIGRLLAAAAKLKSD